MNISRRTLIPAALAAAVSPKIVGATKPIPEAPILEISNPWERYRTIPSDWRVKHCLYGKGQIYSFTMYIMNVVILDKIQNKVVDTRIERAFDLMLYSPPDTYDLFDTRSGTLRPGYVLITPALFNEDNLEDDSWAGSELEVMLRDGRIIEDTIVGSFSTEAEKHLMMPWFAE